MLEAYPDGVERVLELVGTGTLADSLQATCACLSHPVISMSLTFGLLTCDIAAYVLLQIK